MLAIASIYRGLSRMGEKGEERELRAGGGGAPSFAPLHRGGGQHLACGQPPSHRPNDERTQLPEPATCAACATCAASRACARELARKQIQSSAAAIFPIVQHRGSEGPLNALARTNAWRLICLFSALLCPYLGSLYAFSKWLIPNR